YRAYRRFSVGAINEGKMIACIADMIECDTEGDAVFCHHDVGRVGDVVDPGHLFAAADVDRHDIGGCVAVLGAQIQYRLHRGMRRDVAGEALEHDGTRGITLAQPASKLVRIKVGATEYAQEAELAFEHARWTSKPVGGERSREHAALGRAPEMKTLHH